MLKIAFVKHGNQKLKSVVFSNFFLNLRMLTYSVLIQTRSINTNKTLKSISVPFQYFGKNWWDWSINLELRPLVHTV